MPRDDWSSLPTLGDDPGRGPGPTPTPSVTLSTSSFTSGAQIGLDYQYDQGQCGGQNTSPQLSWQIDDLPDGATITSWEVSASTPPRATSSTGPSPTSQPIKPPSLKAAPGGRRNCWDHRLRPGSCCSQRLGRPLPASGQDHTYTIVVTANYNDGGAQTLSSQALTFMATGGAGGDTGGGVGVEPWWNRHRHGHQLFVHRRRNDWQHLLLRSKRLSRRQHLARTVLVNQ